MARFAVAMSLALAVLGAEAVHFTARPDVIRYPSPRQTIVLDGEWSFRMSGPNCPESESRWRSVTTPFVAATNSFLKGLRQDYRRTVDLPDPAGRRLIIHAECMPEICEVFINGKLATTHMPGSVPFDVDITSFVAKGANEIQLSVRRATREENVLNGGAWFAEQDWILGCRYGYWRPVVLEIRPNVSVEDVAISTIVSPVKRLTAAVVLTNATDRPRSVVVSAAVKGWAGDSRQVDLAPHAGATVALARDWPEAELWCPDDPRLHMLELTVRESGTLVDARHERFGFRQITWDGGELRLNGIPVMMKRGLLYDKALDDVAMRECLLRMKRRGLAGARAEVIFIAGLVDIADEIGFFLTPMVNAYGVKARHQNPKSWLDMRKWCMDTVRAYKNHPSVLAWAVGGEYASYYGLTANVETNKFLTEKCQEIGRAVGEADPTRPWTTAGDNELGWPLDKHGPADIRSFHYPNPPTLSNYLFPESAWWYKRGELSFQKLSDRTKPLVIGEDLYHGFLDQFFGETKWANDKIWTYQGFLEAWRDTVWMMADGFYDAGLSGWQIWNAHDGDVRNDLYDDVCGGQLMPDYLISIRDSFPNLEAGSPEDRRLTVYNRRFTDCRADLVTEVLVCGAVVRTEKREITVPAGRRTDLTVRIEAPTVEAPQECVYRFSLRNGLDKTVLFSRDWNFNVFPKRAFEWPEEIAVVDAGSDVESAIATGRPVAVLRNLKTEEGRLLKEYVVSGGHVMLVDLTGGWTPLPLQEKRACSFVYRRSDGSLPGISDAMLKNWRTNSVVAANGYRKPSDRTVQVLLDSGHSDGLTGMQCGRLYDGMGHWFLLQLPVWSRKTDPAADWVLSCATREFLGGGAALARHLTIAENDPIGKIWRNDNIRFDNLPDSNSVMAINCAMPVGKGRWDRIKKHAAAGGVIFLHSVAKTNAAHLVDIGIDIVPVERNEYCVRSSCGGLLDGISNDDLYFSGRKIGDVLFSRMNYGAKPLSVWKDEFLTGALVGNGVLTDPGALADVRFGDGRIVVSTIRLSEECARHPHKTNFLLRNLLRNMGVNAADIARETTMEPLDLSREINRPMWNDPHLSGATKAWFGGADDMRYFPVNLCGWSRDSGADCPVETVPTSPINYAGFPFRISQALFEGRQMPGILVLSPGEKRRIKTWRRNLTSLRFLGALEKHVSAGDKVLKVGVGGFHFGHVDETPVTGDYINGYAWENTVKKGRIAWCGYSKNELDAVLYTWEIPVSSAKRTGEWTQYLDFENVGKNSLAIVAITTESVPRE